MVKVIRTTNALCFLILVSLIASSFSSSVFADDVTLEVGINETLNVAVTTPDNWAQGDIDTSTGMSDFLRNKIVVDVTSNNAAGFTVSMRSKNTTNLVNLFKNTATIPTLTSASTAGSFPVNYWGYSLDDTDAGTTAANYAAMQTTAIQLGNSSTAGSLTKPVFFGAKANASKDSGTYANTVIISVVSGVIDDPTNPVIPVDPATPEDTVTDNPSYDSTNNRTVYTATTHSGSGTTATTTTTTQVSMGDTRAEYTSPYGVTSTTLNDGSGLGGGLATTAGLAASSGIFFFILARKKDEEEEEEEEL